MVRRTTPGTALLACMVAMACIIATHNVPTRGLSVDNGDVITCGEVAGPVTIDGNVTGGEWELATSRDITLDIGGNAHPATIYFMNDHASFYFAMVLRDWNLQLLDTVYLLFGPAEHDGSRDVDVKRVNLNIGYQDMVNMDVSGPLTFDGSDVDGLTGGLQHGTAGIARFLDTNGHVLDVTSVEVRFPLDSGDDADIALVPGHPVEFRLGFESGELHRAFHPAAGEERLFLQAIHVDPPPAIDGFLPPFLAIGCAAALLALLGNNVKKKKHDLAS